MRSIITVYETVCVTTRGVIGVITTGDANFCSVVSEIKLKHINVSNLVVTMKGFYFCCTRMKIDKNLNCQYLSVICRMFTKKM